MAIKLYAKRYVCGHFQDFKHSLDGQFFDLVSLAVNQGQTHVSTVARV